MAKIWFVDASKKKRKEKTKFPILSRYYFESSEKEIEDEQWTNKTT